MESLEDPAPASSKPIQTATWGWRLGSESPEQRRISREARCLGRRETARSAGSAPRPPAALTYGGNKGGVEGIIRKAKKDAGLAHSRVPDQEQLEKQVVRLLRHWEGRLGLSPPAAPRDRPRSPRPTPLPGVLRPEDGAGVGKPRAGEGAGDLRAASAGKPRRWRRPVPPRAATAAPQPLPAAAPGSGESVGTKWPPLPPRGCSAGTLPRAGERALPSRERLRA